MKKYSAEGRRQVLSRRQMLGTTTVLAASTLPFTQTAQAISQTKTENIPDYPVASQDWFHEGIGERWLKDEVVDDFLKHIPFNVLEQRRFFVLERSRKVWLPKSLACIKYGSETNERFWGVVEIIQSRTVGYISAKYGSPIMYTDLKLSLITRLTETPDSKFETIQKQTLQVAPTSATFLSEELKQLVKKQVAKIRNEQST